MPRRTVVGVTLCVAPLLLAVVLLLVGLAASTLVLVYLSMAAAALALPCMAVGIVMVVRESSRR